MFEVVKVDGPNIITNLGMLTMASSQYADGGKTTPVSADDLRRMQQMFLASPALLEALTDLLVECELYRGFHPNAGLLVAARAAIAKAKGETP